MERTQENGSLESTIGKLRGLSNESKVAIASIIDRLANAEGIHVGTNYKLPNESIGHWLTKLKSERKAERTIRLYSYLVRRFLKRIPLPTRADVRNYFLKTLLRTVSRFHR
ncbi:hypothetical protein ACFLVO_01345 [Chloroflexota bacterium]